MFSSETYEAYFAGRPEDDRQVREDTGEGESDDAGAEDDGKDEEGGRGRWRVFSGNAEASPTVSKSLVKIKIFYANAQHSINDTKTLQIGAAACALNADLIMISEFGLPPGHMPDVPGYEKIAYSSKPEEDSKDGRASCGGVACWRKTGSDIKILYSTAIKGVRLFQAVAIHTTVGNFLVIYRSPSQTAQKDIDSTTKVLEEYNIKGYTIIGDLNIPEVDWDTGEPPQHVRKKYSDMISVLVTEFTKQAVREPTRKKKKSDADESGNILDICIVQKATPIQYEILKNLTTENFDHMWILFTMMVSISEDDDWDEDEDDEEETIVAHSLTDWDKFRSILSTFNWNPPGLSVELMQDYLTSKLIFAYEQCLVKKKKKTSKISALQQKSVKISSKILRLGTSRENKNKNKKQIKRLKEEQNEIHKIIKKKKSVAYYNYLNKDRNNIFKKMRSSDPTNGINVIKRKDGSLTSDKQEIVNILANFLVSIFSKPRPEDSSEEIDWEEEVPEGIEEIRYLDITESDVSKVVKNVKSSNGKDPSGISVNMLKNSLQITLPFLTKMLKKSLDETDIPANMKVSFVNFIPKGTKDPTVAENLRPICKSIITLKVKERLLKNLIIDIFQRTGRFHRHQYGFLPGKSTVDNLLYVMQKVQKAIQNGHKCLILACDFAKAFDSINFAYLLKQLQKYGIRGKVGKWLEQWTKSNLFKCVIDDVSSDWHEILSGLKQGSSIGPAAFIIAINTLIAMLPMGSTVLFADDQTIIIQIKASTAQEDVKVVNDILEVCQEWSLESGLKYNKRKCNYIIVPQNKIRVNVKMGEVEIERKSHIEILGVLISDGKKNPFSHHHRRLISNCKAIAYTILKRFRKASFAKKRTLYITYIQSKLLYCSPIWNDQVYGQENTDLTNALNSVYSQIFSGAKPKASDKKRNRLAPMTPAETLFYADICLTQKILSGNSCHDIADFIRKPEDRLRNNGGEMFADHHQVLSVFRRQQAGYSQLPVGVRALEPPLFKKTIEKTIMENPVCKQSFDLRCAINRGKYLKRTFRKNPVYLARKV